MANIIDADLFIGMIRVATPLILVALGGLMCERAGIFNIGVEGYMLMGAFSAILFIDIWGSSIIGLFGGILGGVLLSLLFGLFVIRYKANHILTSLAINFLAVGLTGFLLVPIFSSKGGYRPPNMEMLPTLNLPIIKDIPYIGEILSGHSITVYIGFVMIIVTYVILFKTPFGILVRGLGEDPNTVKTAGVSPKKIQWLVIIWCGVLCGLAGAHFSTGYASEFTENMTQGRGLTAFSAIIFGNSHPGYVFLACLVFGIADVIGIRFELSNVGISPSIIKMFPFTLAIVVLAISSYINTKKKDSLI